MADSYHKRPNYPRKIIDEILDFTDHKCGDRICDIGAGTGNLSLLLAEKGLYVRALEPNLAMYALRAQSTRNYPRITWENTAAEDTRITTMGSEDSTNDNTW